MNHFKLGQTLRDKTTGFTGTAVQRVYQFSGNIQYGLQPKTDSVTTYPDAMLIDFHLLEVVDEGISDVLTSTLSTNIKIGSKVKYIITNNVGIVTSRCDYLNGCVSFHVIFKKKWYQLLTPEPSWVSANSLELISSGVSDKIRSSDTKETITGGPSQRLSSNKAIKS